MDSLYVARNKAIKASISINTEQGAVQKKALLDSGATKCFVHPSLVKELKILTTKLKKPRRVRNVDGTINKAGAVTEVIILEMLHGDHRGKHMFFVADIGEDELILGYPFFEATNPLIDWSTGQTMGTVWLTRLPSTPMEIALKKTTVAQQLAEQAADKQKKTWEELVPTIYHRFGQVFSEKASERFPGRWRWDHAIDLKPDAPASIDCRVYPLSPKEKEEQKEFLATNRRLQHIRRSDSPYASRFFLIRKKDGKFRPVQDYRNLNKYTIPNKYPLPLISELIHDLAGKKLFSKFDIRWGYNNICIKEGDEWKAAFKTSDGLFEPTVMFFRLTNSPATFQTMMDDIFQEEVAQGWLSIYMDDAIIAMEDDAVLHKSKVDHFLDKLQKNDLFLKPEKCKFHQKQVEYLGVIIGNGKVEMDLIKVEGITKWLVPKTVKDVRSFLGFCNFYRAFIPHFSDIAQPLNGLTKKNYVWTWWPEQQEAFDTLKCACTSYPVLYTPDWTRPFIMETNASGFALGAVIAQEFADGTHPIAFHSRSLHPAKKNYDAHDKELAGIVFGFKCGRPFFLGATHPITICTDHKNLQYFRKPQKITGRQARWIEFLQDFDYTLEHIPGSTNTIADLLSCRKDLNKGVDTDLPRILLPDYLFARKIFLKDDADERRQILRLIHDAPTGGHPGIANTWDLVKQQYEGPRLRQFVEEYVKGCTKCQESKANIPRIKAPLQCFDTHPTEGPFQYVSMDLITDLPRSDGYDSILTIVDQGCSKAAKFIPCCKTIDGPGVAHEYLKHLVPWFGTPKWIISDRDPRFASNFSRTLCHSLGIQQNLSTAFHPRTNGQTEHMNAWVEQYLWLWTSGKQDNWAKMLPLAEFAHNSWKHDVTRQTPHELLIGCRLHIHIKTNEGNTPAAVDRVTQMEEARLEAHKRLEALKTRHDQRKIPEMKEGDQVWLEGKNLQVTGQQKLLPRRYGPFKILKRIRPVAYRLDLPPSMKVHDVFHIDLLLPYKETGAYGIPFTWPPLIIEEGEEEYEIESIRDARRRGRGHKLQYLVHWKGYPNSDDSWVNHKDVHAPELLEQYYLNSAEAGQPNV
jgi:RNase H-like domain found in reverse transcriptase/Reverse transcriptase (RNA-dependent DNA polymerase)/Integrase zinc binding domain/Chromo (CHRromatin Organisation MOdifier) domain/Aspartyl protease